MSLRDELLKAGLTSSDKAKKLDSDVRKQDHQRKKGKAPISKDEMSQAETRRQVEAEIARKRDQDRQMNRARDAEKQCREQDARARQLIEAHCMKEPEAEIAYHFQNGRRICMVRVTAAQRRALALGQLAVVRGDRHEFDVSLVPREIAQKLTQFAPDRVLLLHPESSVLDPEDDWGI